jgi:hypothetical protein
MRKIVRRRTLVLLGGITAIGTVLRLTSTGRIGLWRDEAQALNIAVLPSVDSVIRFLYLHESHPPLFHVTAHIMGHITGHVFGSMSILVLVASVALIPAAWWLASLSDVRGAGPIAATLVSVSVPLSFYSVQIRPYSLLSLCLVVTLAAQIKCFRSPAPKWKLIWVLLSLMLLYLHHVGLLILFAAAVTTAYVGVKEGGWRSTFRSWSPYALLTALCALPYALLLLHQGTVANYPSTHPTTLLRPLLTLMQLMVIFPGELGVGVVAALLVLLRTRSFGPRVTTSSMAVYFIALIVLLTVATYRSHFLVPHVGLAMAPVGMVVAAIVLAQIWSQRRPWPRVMATELLFCSVLLSAYAQVGVSKTNTDLIARYIMAEATPSDLILLFPGAAGASFNRYASGSLSQIDYPIAGRVFRYEFDDVFLRDSSGAALLETIESLRSACSTGRRVWLVSPEGWLIGGNPPVELDRNRFGGLGQASKARLNLIERRTVGLFGPPIRTVNPDSGMTGVELLQARLYGPTGRDQQMARETDCDPN